LGSSDAVLAVLDTLFGEVRSEVKTERGPDHGIVRWPILDAAFWTVVNFIANGPSLKYPLVEAYVFDPFGLLWFHIGDPVQRVHVVLENPTSEEISQFERICAQTGWTHRNRRWSDWFRSR
jgi:hypothetical protein